MGFSAPPPSSPLSSRGVEDMSHQRPACYNPNMRREQDRLDSFHSWTLTIITPAELAKAGFYYLGQGDQVACFSCGGQVCIIIQALIELDKRIIAAGQGIPTCSDMQVRSEQQSEVALFVFAVKQLGARWQSCVRTPAALSKLPFCVGGQSWQCGASCSCFWRSNFSTVCSSLHPH